MARGDRVIANSLYTARLIADRHRVPPERIRIIYRGIDLSKFAPDAINPGRLARLRAIWDVREGQPVILQAARLTGWKGQRFVIESARQLLSENRLLDAVFIQAGDAQGREAYRNELEQLIAASGLAARVKLVGHCDDMPAAFAIATVAIIASTSAETFGRTGIEAQAMGCPVIVSDIGAAPETIIAPEQDETRFTGWLIPPRDSAALAARIHAALALSPEERAAISARASARARTEFALSHMQRKTLAVYDELLGSNLAGAFSR
jgi:glycosyltransferase involved in cell wall biosynthesis